MVKIDSTMYMYTGKNLQSQVPREQSHSSMYHGDLQCPFCLTNASLFPGGEAFVSLLHRRMQAQCPFCLTFLAAFAHHSHRYHIYMEWHLIAPGMSLPIEISRAERWQDYLKQALPLAALLRH
jgi:hypothetical protein